MSNAIGFDQFGDADVFKEKEVALELNSVNNVLIKVERVGINPVDTFIRSGKMSGGDGPHSFQVLGAEIQGEIVDLHPDVIEFKVGDKVIARPGRGGYAEYLVTNASNVFKVPANMPLDFAAGFSATAATAYWALYGGFYHMQPGDTLAVVGASGSVGSFVVQLAKKFQVRVLAVGSLKNADYLLELGADVFIDYNNELNVKEYEKEADFVIDASLFNAGEKVALALLKDGGTYLGLTSLPRNVNRDVKLVFLARTPEMSNEVAMKQLLKQYEDSGLSLKIAYTLPLTVAGVQKAHQLIEGQRNSGKIILSIYE